ncbi:hypothetical protein SDC9_150348 [bioreactor metagenome]|uniref:Type II secretion system protein G n=1 Tax=bioreactor metagenome TaxID=1076179 RepID=A0A645EM83_9ZZZZ
MRRKNFTLNELLIVIALLGLNLALLAALAPGVKTSAQLTSCTSHLVALGKAVEAYRADNAESFMIAISPGNPGPTWATRLGSTAMGNYVKAENFNCPSMPVYLPERWQNASDLASQNNWMWTRPAYGYNDIWLGGVRRGANGLDGGKPYSMAALEEPSEMLVLADSAGPGREFGSYRVHPGYVKTEAVLWPRHDGAVNVLYADGHVKATASGLDQAGEESSQKLYVTGAELESSSTKEADSCKWRCGLD